MDEFANIALPDDFENILSVLFIRGERPILDEKYSLMAHPNINLTPDGKGISFSHHSKGANICRIEIDEMGDFPDVPIQVINTNYELISDEEIEEI